MIGRVGAIALLIYLLGFVLFCVTLSQPAPADAPRTDAVIVLTGGSGRIEQGMAILRGHQARRMLVAGADPSVTKADIARRVSGSRKLIDCCVDLGSESVDTRSNAQEAARWMTVHGFRSYRLITSDWHMRRAAFEFSRPKALRGPMVQDAVRGEPAFSTLLGEYNKYLLRRLSVWVDL